MNSLRCRWISAFGKVLERPSDACCTSAWSQGRGYVAGASPGCRRASAQPRRQVQRGRTVSARPDCRNTSYRLRPRAGLRSPSRNGTAGCRRPACSTPAAVPSAPTSAPPSCQPCPPRCTSSGSGPSPRRNNERARRRPPMSPPKPRTKAQRRTVYAGRCADECHRRFHGYR